MVKNNLSPTSPMPGLSMPRSVSSASNPASQISVPSGHSFAASSTPGLAPRMDRTRIRFVPHSFRVWIAAAEVPPVAMTGSRTMVRSGVFSEEEEEERWLGRLL